MRLQNVLHSTILACGMCLVLSAQSDRVPRGTEITVRTNDSISAKSSNDGRMYSAVVDRDVMDQSGRVVVPKGSPAELTVRNTSDNNLTIDLEAVNVNGRRYVVDSAEQAVTAEEGRDGVGKNSRTAKYVGGGAVIGSIIGAIAGGGKGAAIGAATGAGAGALGQTVTRGKSVKVPSETLLTFRLDRSLRMSNGDSGYNRFNNGEGQRSRSRYR